MMNSISDFINNKDQDDLINEKFNNRKEAFSSEDDYLILKENVMRNELNNLKNKINIDDDLVKELLPGEKAIAALFISTDQNLTYLFHVKIQLHLLKWKKNYMKNILNIKKLIIISFIMEIELKDLKQWKKIKLKAVNLLFLI